MPEPPPVVLEPPRPFPVRLRGVIGLSLVAAALWAAYPRARSTYLLHTLAPALADYAACMVGPLGPSLLRDGSHEFRALLRRRLVGSPPDDRPFARCAEGARLLTQSPEIERAHQASAASFVEYGGAAADRAGQGSHELDLDALRVSTKPLADLARASWPFAREGWVHLVKPSPGAKEAVHPVELPRPRLGRGLPAWRAQYKSARRVPGAWLLAVGSGANLSAHRSTDDGLTWSESSPRDPALEEFRERCSAAGSTHSFTFGLSDDGASLTLSSAGSDGSPTTVTVGGADRRIVGASCDDGALVVALGGESTRDVSVLLCRHRLGCTPIDPPRFEGLAARFPLDVARVQGATIVATVAHGVTRVSSTRDDGATWTPWSVAYDAAAYPEFGNQSPAPGRLLVLDQRVALYGGSTRSAPSYPALVSDDLGASWRTP